MRPVMAVPIDSSEEWMLDSLLKYDKLHIFELQQPTLCMEWNHDGSAIFVGGYSTDHHNELLQLLLPEKLLASNSEQNLLAKRDFKIGRGAISKEPIHCIAVLQQNSCLATSSVRQEVWLWGPDHASPDLFASLGAMATPPHRMKAGEETKLLLSSSPHSSSSLLTGSSLLSLQLIDINLKRATWKNEDYERKDVPLHSLHSLPSLPPSFLSCCGERELLLWDPRKAGGPVKFSNARPPQNRGPPERYAVAVNDNSCACVSDRGSVCLYDLRRSLDDAFASCKILARDKSTQHWFSQKKASSFLCARFSPNGKRLSVSGLERGVAVYDTTTWNRDMGAPTPLFTHTGHEVDAPSSLVTVHSWHPSLHSTLLSSDSDSCLHIWQWREGKG